MRIGICDDERSMIDLIQEHCQKIFEEMQVKASFIPFSNGRDLMSALEKEKMDILLLDIDMPEISGMEVARMIREECEDIILIFVSSYEKYVFASLEYTPFRFIRKTHMKQELPVALRAAETLYQKNKKRYVIIRSEDIEKRVEQSQIRYVDVVKRMLAIHLADGNVIYTWKTIKEIEKELSEDSFARIHSGCVVNLKHVDGYKGNQIMLDNEESLFASRAGIKIFREKLARYWSR